MEKGKIYAAMIGIMGKCSAIGKGRRNEQQNYNFRGIDDVANELHNHFSDQGVFILPEVLEINQVERQTQRGGAIFYTTVKVKYTFMADDGSFVTVTTVGEGMDSADKSTNKAVSAALKYALIQIFLIPTKDKKDSEDDDYKIKPGGNGEAPKKQSPPPPPGVSDKQLEVLEKMVKNAASRKELSTIWKTNAQYQHSEKFTEMVKKRRGELPATEPQTQSAEAA